MKTGKISVIVSFVSLIFSSNAIAATYYVALTGDNTWSGSSVYPWRTLQYAADRVSAGDTVHIRTGSYRGFRAKSSGSSGLPITFKSENGATVVLNETGPDAWHGSIVEIEGYHWWELEDLEVTGAPSSAGIDVRLADHVIVKHCYCHHNQKWGIFTAFAENFTAQYNECSYSSEEHGIYHSNSGDNAILSYNTCHHNSGCGIQINADPSMGGDGISSNNKITHNTLYKNGTAGGAAINLASVRDSLIANNLMYDNSAGGMAAWDDGQGYEWGSKDNKYYNNTVHMPSNGRWAINLGNGSTGCLVRNNILIHESSFRGGLEIDGSSLEGFSSDYNIITRVSVDDTTMTLSEWQAAYSRDAHSTVHAAIAIFRAPGSDYHLLPTSYARNHGTTLPEIKTDIEDKTRPQGSAYDIGCYESAISLSPMLLLLVERQQALSVRRYTP